MVLNTERNSEISNYIHVLTIGNY